MQSVGTSLDLGLKHGSGLMRLAGRLAGAGDDAEDLVQATYVRALEQGAQVERPRSWLRRVLRNERNMALRGRIRREARERSTFEPEPADVEQVVHALEVTRLIREMVDDLDDKLAHVIRARYFDGLSAVDIGEQEGIPPGTVRWRLKRGLDELRHRLDHQHGGRRALWAGALMPAKFLPTPGGPAASGGGQAAAGTGLAAKGTSMTTKILLSAAALTATVSTAWLASDDHATTSDEETVALAEPGEPLKSPAANAASPKADLGRAQLKAQWETRRRDIRSALASARPAATDDQPAVKTGAVGEPTVFSLCDGKPCTGDEPGIGGMTQAEMLEVVLSQIQSMVASCGEFLEDAPRDLSLEANIIGAPDIGSVVETVDLTSSEDVPADLEECLSEAVYAFDFGDVETPFENAFNMYIGDSVVTDSAVDAAQLESLQAALEEFRAEGHPADVVAMDPDGNAIDLEGLDEETIAAIDALLKQGGENVEIRMLAAPEAE